ncbi:MAG: hypothetical protein ACK5L5_09910, partial [Bacteroidales bacterium]
NGEDESLFGKYFTDRMNVDNDFVVDNFRDRAVPYDVSFFWLADGSQSLCEIYFKEKEIYSAFEEVFKDSPDGEAEMIIRLNMLESYASVRLVGNGKEVWISENYIKVRKI